MDIAKKAKYILLGQTCKECIYSIEINPPYSCTTDLENHSEGHTCDKFFHFEERTDELRIKLYPLFSDHFQLSYPNAKKYAAIIDQHILEH